MSNAQYTLLYYTCYYQFYSNVMLLLNEIKLKLTNLLVQDIKEEL